jgi:hypothetical protein
MHAPAAPDPKGPNADEPAAPLGSWPRTYAATIALAIVVMLLLWWLTAAANTPLGSAR